MIEKLLPYIQLGINFLKGLLEFALQLLGLLESAEGAISGQQATAF